MSTVLEVMLESANDLGTSDDDDEDDFVDREDQVFHNAQSPSKYPAAKYRIHLNTVGI